MGYDNVLFNGKSMRNAIITKLSEDKHLTSALFANSNITILIDILSYMYQCLMSNLRQAASESMWSDTIFFENASRLAKLIGYYAKGQIPFTMLAKITEGNLSDLPLFSQVTLSYGPYEYDFAVVEQNVNNDQSAIRLALGYWPNPKIFTSDGTKFQEFIIEKDVANYENPSYISQKYMRVFTVTGNEDPVEWTYSPDPLFLIQNDQYTELDPQNNPFEKRTLIGKRDVEQTNVYNFYINENGDYVLKFGDGLSTNIPPDGSNIYVFYVSCTETESTIPAAAKSALVNASDSDIVRASFSNIDDPSLKKLLESNGESNQPLKCIPTSTLSGYRDRDSAESIRTNSRNSFSRQNRLVTKEDYRSYLLEEFSEWEDVTVQNNWEYVSSFYGWLYAIAQNIIQTSDPTFKAEYLINPNKLENFNNSDLADANNVYVWVLAKDAIDINQSDSPSVGIVGILRDLSTGMDKGATSHSIGAMKDITEHPIFLNALCKRFAPFAGDNIGNFIDYENPDPFNGHDSYFRIHVDSNYAASLNIIKAKTFSYVKSYLFDGIKLGKTPNIPALIKDLMSIEGVINITTVFNIEENGPISTEKEVNGMRFCTWTDTDSVLFDPSNDVAVTYNLPNIPVFQYFKAAQSFASFIDKSIQFKIDYSIKN